MTSNRDLLNPIRSVNWRGAFPDMDKASMPQGDCAFFFDDGESETGSEYSQGRRSSTSSNASNVRRGSSDSTFAVSRRGSEVSTSGSLGRRPSASSNSADTFASSRRGSAFSTSGASEYSFGRRDSTSSTSTVRPYDLFDPAYNLGRRDSNQSTSSYGRRGSTPGLMDPRDPRDLYNAVLQSPRTEPYHHPRVPPYPQGRQSRTPEPRRHSGTLSSGRSRIESPTPGRSCFPPIEEEDPVTPPKRGPVPIDPKWYLNPNAPDSRQYWGGKRPSGMAPGPLDPPAPTPRRSTRIAEHHENSGTRPQYKY
ncbi:hypothetical protein GYMLUDRAFT_990251 [Collybiopsis luxurians FD-317 M1]|uniref:Uncharacterized protein n=1 Tax=Collybiopsis luxurians FD-317 M1 TaxID=944289 RepID=A0A0D0CJ60_9AGAR|nr:hypothetical protein GYMLUDRAFT_990251 [Collybiopsis luxurians FD-317 M1]